VSAWRRVASRDRPDCSPQLLRFAVHLLVFYRGLHRYDIDPQHMTTIVTAYIRYQIDTQKFNVRQPCAVSVVLVC